MTDPRTIPTEQLLSMTDRPQGPGVYVLELDTPGVTLGPEALHAHARWWWHAGYREQAGYRDVQPDDVAGLADCERLLYVGATSNVQDRLEDHVQADTRKSAWLSVYPPVELVQVEIFPSAERAFESETQTAYQVAQATPDTTAVVCNGEVVG